MKNLHFSYPKRITRKHFYCVRFQTDKNDNNVNCWMNGFPLGRTPFSEVTLPLEKAGKYWYEAAVGIRRILKPNCFDGEGILSLVSYSDSVKLDSELKKLAANGK